MSNELTTRAPFKSVVGGLAAKKAAANANALALGKPIEEPADKCKNRIGIVFDDSGSMYNERIKNAHLGCEEFLRSCTPNETAVAVYPLNAASLPLNKSLPAVAIMIKRIEATGGTYIRKATEKMFAENNLTRAIIFSDGANGDGDLPDAILKKGICIDTVYIGHPGDERAINYLRNIAEKTDGIFLIFDPNKSNFATAFKYLSPGLRYMLADKSFADKLQGR